MRKSSVYSTHIIRFAPLHKVLFCLTYVKTNAPMTHFYDTSETFYSWLFFSAIKRKHFIFHLETRKANYVLAELITFFSKIPALYQEEEEESFNMFTHV